MYYGQLNTARFYCTIESMNHYETLNVSPDASKEQIKSSYRKLAAKHHPDRGGSTERFQEIQNAYDTLMDDARRKEYDYNMHIRDHYNSKIEDIFRENIFQDFGFSFGKGENIFTRTRHRKNPDIKTQITIELKETLSDAQKFIRVKTKNNEDKTLEIKIPRGIKSGTVLKFSGVGEKIFANMPAGDLYLTVDVIENQNFMLRGLDLEKNIKLNCFDAILGVDIEIETLSGKTYSIKVPPYTQQNTKFKIPGEGLYEFQKDIRGNFYVRTNIVIPETLSSTQLELVNKIKNAQ